MRTVSKQVSPLDAGTCLSHASPAGIGLSHFSSSPAGTWCSRLAYLQPPVPAAQHLPCSLLSAVIKQAAKDSLFDDEAEEDEAEAEESEEGSEDEDGESAILSEVCRHKRASSKSCRKQSLSVSLQLCLLPPDSAVLQIPSPHPCTTRFCVSRGRDRAGRL